MDLFLEQKPLRPAQGTWKRVFHHLSGFCSFTCIFLSAVFVSIYLLRFHLFVCLLFWPGADLCSCTLFRCEEKIILVNMNLSSRAYQILVLYRSAS